MNNTLLPRVTVAMTSYNGGKMLKQAIQTILKQDYTNFDFIISDDGSTDGSLEYIQEVSERDPRIKLFIHKENMGSFANYYFVFKQVKTEYFMFADQDDYWEPAFISACISLFDKYPNISTATTYTQFISSQDDSPLYIDKSFNTIGLSPIQRYQKYRFDLIAGTNIGGLFCGIHKLKAFKKFMPLENLIGGDHLPIAGMSLEFEFATEPRVLFHKREGGSSDSLEKLADMYKIKKNWKFKLAPMLPRELAFIRIIFKTESLSSKQKIETTVWSIAFYIFAYHNKFLLKIKRELFPQTKFMEAIKSKKGFLNMVKSLIVKK